MSIDDIKKGRILTPEPTLPIMPRVGRKRINDEQIPARFPSGTLARMDAVLVDKEKRADLIRKAIERELQKRERRKVREG